MLCGINGGHHYLCREFVATHHGLGVGDDECAQLVHADILHVDVGHQGVQHLALGIADVALQFGKQRDGCGHRHSLKHVFLPVFAHGLGVFGQLCGEVAADDFLLPGVGHHGEDTLAEIVDGIIEGLALAGARGEHHTGGGFEVFLVDDVVHIALGAVGFTHDFLFQLLCKVEERVAHAFHGSGLFKPSPHLLRIGLHLCLEIAIQRLVLCRRVAGGAVQAFFHDGEALKHLGRDVERKHGHQDDIHQVDHLLAG